VHEILATGCIQALPKASNLFHEEAFSVAFYFVLEVAICFFVEELFFIGAEDGFVFKFECFVLLYAEAA
jgi:hypothetical protein